MELCEDGSLYDVWMQKRRFEESSVKLILQRLARAVEYLHKQGLCPPPSIAACYSITNS